MSSYSSSSSSPVEDTGGGQDDVDGEGGANKQLPLRSRTEKPVLKYSSSQLANTRPLAVPLFNHADIHNFKQQVSTYPSPNISTGFIPPSMSYRPQLLSAYTFMASNSATSAAYGGTGFHTAGGMGATSASTMTTKDPYSHPLCATDLQASDLAAALQSFGASLLHSGSSSSTGSGSSSSGYTGSSSVGAPTNTTPSIQTNAFLRPQSALRVERKTQPSPKPKERNHVRPKPSGSGIFSTVVVQSRPASSISHVDTSSEKSETSSKTPDGATKPTTSAAAVPRPPTAKQKNLTPKPYTATPTSSMPRPPTATKPIVSRTNLLMIKPASANSSSVLKWQSKDEKVSTGDVRPKATTSTKQTSNTTILGGSQSAGTWAAQSAKSHSIQDKDLSDSSQASTKISKPPVPRPRSHVQSTGPQLHTSEKINPKPPASRPTSVSPGSPAPRVRNPNYTPAKPYAEVCSATEIKVEVQEQPVQGRPPSGVSKTRTNQSKLVSASSSSVKTATSEKTMFYRKSSKAEEVLVDLNKRPVADGAPSRSKVAELKRSGSKDRGSEDDWVSFDDEDSDDEGPDSERLPGDGEDFGDFDEDDGIDDIEDDVDGASDDDSDGISLSSSAHSRARMRSATKRLLGLTIKDRASTVTSSSSSTSTSTVRSRPPTTRSRPISSVSTLSSDSDLQPALTPSLFSFIPPTVNFVTDGEKVEQLPWEIRKLLKWRMSPITPNVVKSCISRSGFKPSKKNHDWLGYWGKHMKAPGFKAIREYQKINHFPGSFQIGRKDRLWRNLSKYQVHYGKREFGFFPQTFILPFDLKQLKRAWEDGGNKQKWIIKPPASARGIGIKVIHKWNQIPKRRPVIVQKYLSRPYLINDSKFDLRIYVYVTSYDPLRIYVYDDGLVRFASCKYSHALKNLNNRYMHLTNYSINKKNADYVSNGDDSVCQGHKWSMKALWGYLKKKGVDTNRVWENIIDLIIKTVISSESCVNSLVKTNVRRRYCCHELFGFDVMLDETLKPWIIEVNISPSLHSNSQLDINVKGGMIKDLFNICGFMIPDKKDVVPTPGAPPEPSRYHVPNEICIDRRLYPTQISPDERAKHAYYCQRHLDEFAQATILDILSPDDLRILTESIDEDSRRGNYQRVFPSPTSHKYLKFFEAPRYYNLLLDNWVQRYHRMEARGVSLLESFCQRGVHLQNLTDDPRHQWAPPAMGLTREQRVVSAPGTGFNKTLSSSSSALPRLKKKLKAHSSSTSSLGSTLMGASPRPSTHKATRVNDTS